MALASFLQARSCGGRWLVRIEDIDPPREVRGSAEQIIASLDAHGLHWDGDVIWQSENFSLHTELIDRLIADGKAFACRCSREDVRARARSGRAGAVYPGTCREANHPVGDELSALRLITDSRPVNFTDAVHGEITCDVAGDIGDFIIRRKDGLIAYALAVVADDGTQGVGEVVRGCDLLPVTPAHVYLQRALDLPSPVYLHVPTAVDARGQKLSKQSGAPAVDDRRPAVSLYECLNFLGQDPPTELRDVSTGAVLAWAVAHWRPAAIPHLTEKTAPIYANRQ